MTSSSLPPLRSIDQQKRRFYTVLLRQPSLTAAFALNFFMQICDAFVGLQVMITWRGEGRR
jgi:hypothetical protein